MYQLVRTDAYTGAVRASSAVNILGRLIGLDDRERRERLARAAGALDRELAANLELAAMFDQTHQAALFENGEFARHHELLEREVPAVYADLADVYARIPATESAMERRGPAASVRPEDRTLIEAWEGDARMAQRALREAAAQKPLPVWSRVWGRLRGQRRTKR